jgi:hypothetical protein
MLIVEDLRMFGHDAVVNLIANAERQMLEDNPHLRPDEPQPEPEPKPEPTAEERRLQKLADILAEADFGCQQANVRKIVTALAGVEELPPSAVAAKEEAKPKTKFAVGAIILATRCENEHIVMVGRVDEDGDAEPVIGLGSAGDSLQGWYRHAARLATDEEKRAILDQLFPVSAAPSRRSRPARAAKRETVTA